MSHVLDRPAWNALATHHAAFAEGGPLARRYPPSIIPFAAARDTSPESLAALEALLRHGENMVIAEAGDIVLPESLAIAGSATVAQMVLTRTPEKMPDARIEPLTEADAPAMLALATLTKPGPFTLRAQALGPFYGIRIEGRLAAMAGERMRPQGYAEMSGVAVHPDFQGRGLGRLLSIHMTHCLLERGDTPYLHAYTTNGLAIRLYGTIGYATRRVLNVAMVRRAGG